MFERLISRLRRKALVENHVSLAELDAKLKSATNLEEAWTILSETSRELGFGEVRLQAGDRVWEARFAPFRASDFWQLQVPLNGAGVARFSVHRKATTRTILPFLAGIVHRNLVPLLERDSLSNLQRGLWVLSRPVQPGAQSECSVRQESNS